MTAQSVAETRTEKACSDCDEVKPLSEFHEHPTNVDGRRYRCKECRSERYHSSEKLQEQQAERSQKHYEENREQVIQRAIEWEKEHPERANQTKADWKKRHPRKHAEAEARRRARKEENHVEEVDVDELWEHDDGVCQICGEAVDEDAEEHANRPSIDHIIPLSKGGPHSMDNVQLAHVSCNASKNDSLPKGVA